MAPTAQPSMMCPRCGKILGPGAGFCPHDGERLTEQDSHIGEVLLGQIELQAVCGHGSMGTVYRGWQRTMERRVAVKMLHRRLLRDAQVVKRFQREARAAASLSHPNIITVYLVGETSENQPFIVMEYVDGESLDALLADKEPIPPARAILIARQIASALAEAHDHDIVHRDLKPANILLTSKRGAPDFVKVLDFGIAKILRDGDESCLTKEGAIFGTPYYLSPEQASGDEIDHRCDLYSLGVLLFQMFTGTLPFYSPSAVEVLVKHIKEEPPKPRDLVAALPSAVEALVLKSLQKPREKRWQSAEELHAQLDALAEKLYGGGGTLIGVTDSIAKRDDVHPASLSMSPTGPMTLKSRSDSTMDSSSAGSDPRFRVPTDGELFAASEEGPQASEHGPADTEVLRRRVMIRRRWTVAVICCLLSIAAGSGAGALYYRAGEQPVQVPPAPLDASSTHRATPTDGSPPPLDTEQVAPPPDVASPRVEPRRPKPRRSKTRRPKTRRSKPKRKTPSKLAVPPVGPDPDVVGSDHGGGDEITDTTD